MNFRKFLVEGTQPNWKRSQEYDERSLIQVTALAPVIGFDKASQIADHTLDRDLTLRGAARQLGLITDAEFDRIVDPTKMVRLCVAAKRLARRRRVIALTVGPTPTQGRIQ